MNTALYHIRLIAYLLLLFAVGLLLRNLLRTYAAFNPRYLGYYLTRD